MLLFLLLPTLTSAACPHSSLTTATSLLLRAYTSGTPSILPLTPNTTYYENDTPIPLSTSLLSTPLSISHNLSLHDTTLCATATELITSPSAPHPYVLLTRMQFSSDGEKIVRVESVVADKGDWLFDAGKALGYAGKESWGEVQGTKDGREVIQGAGDRYLDSWADGKVGVPYGKSCARLEGGSYTTNCKMPVFPQEFIDRGGAKNRRYVIDQDLGAVAILNDFPFLDKAKPNGTSSTNILRVEGGQIRYIHEITVCSTANCGR